VSTHLTRRELKQDNVALKVEETFDFLSLHRHQAVRWGAAALVVILLAGGGYLYYTSQQDAREQQLGEAIALQAAPVGQAPPNGGQSFPTEVAKNDAVTKAWAKLAAERSGSAEGYIAEYTLASMDTQAGRMDDARKKYQDVADHAGASYSSLAKLALAQLDFAQNKTADAQSILKDLMDHPTDLVSKNQAALVLAKGIAPTQPEEARKLLLPIAGGGTDVSQIAVMALGELPQK
jgi:predicted negative regulator of RcsB-dependent stress response